jgi:RNA-directed DNA polymerase
MRRLAILEQRDAETYARLVRRVAPAIERRLGPEVFANRTPGGGSLEPWRAARSRWRRSTARLLRTSPIATMDVSRCYDSIGPDAVATALRRFGIPYDGIEDVRMLLRSFMDAGVPGIPVGPGPSAVLANAVLSAVDDALRFRGVAFTRWVDDLVLAIPTGARTGRIESAVEHALGDIGLRSNSAKHRRFDDRDAANMFILRRNAPSGGD